MCAHSLDIILANLADANELHLSTHTGNGGTPTYTHATASPIETFSATSYSFTVVLADINNDQKLDLVVGNCGYAECSHSALWTGADAANALNYAYNEVYFGVGDASGTFTQSARVASGPTHTTISNYLSNTRAIAMADIDEDGNVDYIEANYEYSYDMLNNGRGPNGRGMVPGLRVLLGDGTGGFEHASQEIASHGPESFAFPGPQFSQCLSVAVGDVDGDGDADLLVGTEHTFRVHFNQRSALLQAAASSRRELQSASYLFIPMSRNDPLLTFEAPSVSGGARMHIALGDADSDGDLDLFVSTAELTTYQPGATFQEMSSNVQKNQLYVWEGNTTGFVRVDDSPVTLTYEHTMAAAWLDLDGDGLLDLITGGMSQGEIFFNRGVNYSWTLASDAVDVTGLMNAEGSFIGEIAGSRAMAFGDVDSDGDVDLILTFDGHDPSGAGGNLQKRYHWPGMDRILINDGIGGFEQRVPLSWTHRFGANARGCANEVVMGDLDRDGNLDMVLAIYGYADRPAAEGSNEIWYGRGDGTFRSGDSSTLAEGKILTNAVALADLDNDGYLDIITGVGDGSTPRVRTYMNRPSSRTGWAEANAGGVLSTAGISGSTNQPLIRQILTYDSNGDGHLDLLLVTAETSCATGQWWVGTMCGLGASVQTGWSLYVNDGSGAFSLGSQAFHSDWSYGSIALADVDGDGTVDAVTSKLEVLQNNGASGFSTVQTTMETPFTASLLRTNVIDFYKVHRLVAGDVDADGDIDILAVRDGQNWLFLNDGSGDFARASVSHYSSIDGGDSVAAAMADTDGDGAMEFFVGNADSVTLDGTFEYHASVRCVSGARMQGIEATSCAKIPTNGRRTHKDIVVECDLNQARDPNDNTRCVACAPGSGRLTSQTECSLCDAGEYATQDGMGCRPCPIGHISNSRGALTCIGCEPGHHAPKAGLDTCTECPAGTRPSTDPLCATQATTEIFSCGLDRCVPCEKGKYCPAGTKGDGTPCPQGSTTLGEGAQSSADCVCRPPMLRMNATTTTTELGFTCVSCTEATTGDGSRDGTNCTYEGIALETLPLKKDFWRQARDSIRVSRCFNTDLCNGGTDPIAPDFCREGHMCVATSAPIVTPNRHFPATCLVESPQLLP